MKTTDLLIIEPHQELAAVMAEYAESRGLTCEIADSAQEAVRLADDKNPKMIILEPIMPKHNGVEFIHEFRSYPDWLDIPIILYTNISRDELQLTNPMLQEIGIKTHFYKPTTSFEELINGVESQLAAYHIR